MHGEMGGSWCHSRTPHVKLRLSLSWHEAIWGTGILNLNIRLQVPATCFTATVQELPRIFCKRFNNALRRCLVPKIGSKKMYSLNSCAICCYVYIWCYGKVG